MPFSTQRRRKSLMEICNELMALDLVMKCVAIPRCPFFCSLPKRDRRRDDPKIFLDLMDFNLAWPLERREDF